MRKLLKRSLLSQCVLMSLTSLSAFATKSTDTPCSNSGTAQTCGLSQYNNWSYYQDKGVTDAVMADAMSDNIYMDGARGEGDTQLLTVSGTDMSGHYIQGSNGGHANITVNNNATVDMIEAGSHGSTTHTTVNADHSTLNGQSASGDDNNPKGYMMGSAIYLDPMDKGTHAVNITNSSVLHDSIMSAGTGMKI